MFLSQGSPRASRVQPSQPELISCLYLCTFHLSPPSTDVQSHPYAQLPALTAPHPHPLCPGSPALSPVPHSSPSPAAEIKACLPCCDRQDLQKQIITFKGYLTNYTSLFTGFGRRGHRKTSRHPAYLCSPSAGFEITLGESGSVPFSLHPHVTR